MAQTKDNDPADIRAARERLGWTQSQLAGALCVSRHTMHNWETGRRPAPARLVRQIEQWETAGVRLPEDVEHVHSVYLHGEAAQHLERACAAFGCAPAEALRLGLLHLSRVLTQEAAAVDRARGEEGE